eukprot:SAG25_NODE_8097_length_440_cov_0.953079_1_plen_38_part_10
MGDNSAPPPGSLSADAVQQALAGLLSPAAPAAAPATAA